MSGDRCRRNSVHISGCNLKERGQNVLESGLWADCKFIVGEEKEEMQACRYFLALASPVFERMLFGSLTGTDPVDVPYMMPIVFKKLLQFIYCHSIDFTSIEEAFDICSAAHEYMMPDLIQICSTYMKSRLASADMQLLCNTLNIAVLYNIEDLKQVALKEVQDKTGVLLASPELLTLSADALVTILQRGHLNVKSELELIDAAMCWATARCEHKGLAVQRANLRAILEEDHVLKHLRFLSLTRKELQDGPFKSGIFNREEMTGILRHICTDGDVPPPISVCPIAKHRASQKYSDDAELVCIRMNRKVERIESGLTKEELYYINEDEEPMVVLGVTLPTQVDETHSDVNLCSYEEEIEVTVQSIVLNDPIIFPGSIFASGFYVGRVKYNRQLYIPLQLRDSHAAVFGKGDWFVVIVKFHKSGKYPLFTKISERILPRDDTGVVLGITCKKLTSKT